jgi:ABC-2 type transport system ATP-binding protein
MTQEIIFATHDLSKRYQDTLALNHMDITIRKGEIYGLIGENGAGKTTLMRILSGLAFQTSGELSLFGASDKNGLSKQRKRIGCMIETPAIYPEMTARENLEVQRLQRGISDKSCIDKALYTAGLLNTEKKKATHFSLGMKQRLGLAAALLSEPEFLVLDEPVNGLDPVGIVEIRAILKKLNREYGTTILLSSHMLSELYQCASCYGFIHKGKLLEQITLAQLDERCKNYLSIQVDNVPKAISILESKFSIKKYEPVSGNIIKIYEQLEERGMIAKELINGDILIEDMTIKGDDLEAYYMRLIGGKSYG